MRGVPKYNVPEFGWNLVFMGEFLREIMSKIKPIYINRDMEAFLSASI